MTPQKPLTEIDDDEGAFRFGFLKASMPISADVPSSARALIARRESTLTAIEDFYHYTTLGGFQGIIGSGGFWASDNRFLNDEMEMKDGASIAARVLAHRAAKTQCSGFSTVLDRVKSLISVPPSSGLLVACFSTAYDSLEQWRAYGPSGGICLRLGRAKEGERRLIIGPEQLPFRVFYRLQEKQILLLSIIRRFEREYQADQLWWGEDWPCDHDENFIEYLHLSLSAGIVGFKNEAFAHEAEIRLVVYPSGYPGGLLFRATSFGLVPYVCTGDHRAIGNDGPLPIREVMIGPHSRQPLIAASVRTFLHHHGYKDTEVTLSKVPFRN